MNENENIRIEFFSDAVFAIAITLLILEIKVPMMQGADASINLGTTLLELYPSYFGYVFSFLMIGIYWANHYRMFKLYRRSDDVFLLLNIFFLMCVAFLPFPTAVLAEYLTHPEQRQPAITFYTFGLFLPALAWLLMWLYASGKHRLVDAHLADQFIKRQTAKFVMTNALYLSAILLSLWSNTAGLALCVGLTLLYLIPSKKPEYVESTVENL
jgi:uncharacterized membrane protein